MLQFTVIGGPNGAGKSTFSTHMSRPGTLVFDPDFYKKTIEKQFPDISDEAIEEAVTAKYETFELNALGRQKHLTVETNLRNEFLVERAAIFKLATRPG
jgi:predicted ABC-type ATPase